MLGEAVKYCRRVKKMGMSAACYTKALREPVYFLWEYRRGGKVCAAKFRSKAAKGLSFGNGRLIYDHAIPFKYLQEKLLNLPTVDSRSIKKVLNKFCVSVLITRKENELLDSSGYRSQLPGNVGKLGFKARYSAVGIKIVKNKSNSD